MKKKEIPDKFYKGENQPIVETVGELKKALTELPDDLPIKSTWTDGFKLVVFNHGQDSEHLSFEEEDF